MIFRLSDEAPGPVILTELLCSQCPDVAKGAGQMIPAELWKRMAPKTIGLIAGLVVGATVAAILSLIFDRMGWLGGGAIAAIFGIMVVLPVFWKVEYAVQRGQEA